MADILLDTQGLPTSPSSGKAIVFIDSSAEILCVRRSDGIVKATSYGASTAAQGAGFATDTWLTGSSIRIPSFGFQAGSIIRWMISGSKTAAGVATPIYNIRIGSNQSTADTARLTLTGPAQTAIADIGSLWIEATVRNIGASGVIQGTAYWAHRGTAANTTTSGTGFANDTTGHIEGSSSAFDNSALGGQYISLSINGGASAAWTITQVQVFAMW